MANTAPIVTVGDHSLLHDNGNAYFHGLRIRMLMAIPL